MRNGVPPKSIETQMEPRNSEEREGNRQSTSRGGIHAGGCRNVESVESDN